jgi:hypothetical protein
LGADAKAFTAWVDVLNNAPGLKIVAETTVELYIDGTPHLFSKSAITSYYQGDKFFHELKEERMDAASKAKPPQQTVVSFDGERCYVIQARQFAHLTEGKPPERGLGLRYFENPFAVMAVALGASPPDVDHPCAPALAQMKSLLSPERIAALALKPPVEMVGELGPILQFAAAPDPSADSYVQQLSVHKESGCIVGAVLRQMGYPSETVTFSISKLTALTINGRTIPFPAEYIMKFNEHPKEGPMPAKVTWTLKEAQVLSSTSADRFVPDPRQYGVTKVYDTETKQVFELK